MHWCIVLCVASFVAGYSVAWNSFGAIYISVPPACEAIENPVPSYSDTSLNSSKKKSDRRKKEFHDFFYELIDSSFGEHLIFESNVTGETLKENYRRALIRALTSDNVPIETNASVKPKEFAPPTDIHQTKHDELLIHRLPVSVTNMHGVGRVDLNDFTALMDTGVPLSLTKQKKRDVLILYGSENSLPDHANDVIFAGNDVLLRAQEAFKNCQSVSVIHLSSKVEDKCWALVPGQESFHIQKWVRAAGAVHPKVDSSAPLRLVARGYDLGSGFSYPRPPTKQQAKQHRQWLGDYLSNADSMAAELKPILERIAINKQLVFSVVNAGQSTLLLNFACAARSHGLDISRMLVFVLDEESKELAEWLGMAAYYNQKFLGELPSSDPTSFGDTTYTHIIVAKFIGPHLLSMLGYDFLSQDVDVIWYKDPLTFFNDPMLAEPSVDIFFQVSCVFSFLSLAIP